jgi:hypothetical protein
VNPQEQRTLGEVQLVTEQSAVRMEECVRYLQETMEELFQLRHEYWIRALEDDPAAALAPQGVQRALSARGVGNMVQGGRFTADLLRGNFHGKPRGSVETANLRCAPTQRSAGLRSIKMFRRCSSSCRHSRPCALGAVPARVSRARPSGLLPPPEILMVML